MKQNIKHILGDIFVLLCLIMMAVGAYVTYLDMTKPAPDPFAKCVQLPSSDKVNYWRCEK